MQLRLGRLPEPLVRLRRDGVLVSYPSEHAPEDDGAGHVVDGLVVVVYHVECPRLFERRKVAEQAHLVARAGVGHQIADVLGVHGDFEPVDARWFCESGYLEGANFCRKRVTADVDAVGGDQSVDRAGSVGVVHDVTVVEHADPEDDEGVEAGSLDGGRVGFEDVF